MTAAPVLFTHPLVPPLRPGDIVYTWCCHQWDRTEHVYDPHAKVPLTCLVCHPEKDPRKEGENDGIS
jgi:hypothetical protein